MNEVRYKLLKDKKRNFLGGSIMMIKNKKWILKERPTGLVKDSDFELVSEVLPAINEGEILIRKYIPFF